MRLYDRVVECALPGATLNGGQWIGPEGEVPCSSSGSSGNENLGCRVGSGARLDVYVLNGTYLNEPGDGWYKCCLPTSCSDPSTNIIFARIFSKWRM